MSLIGKEHEIHIVMSFYFYQELLVTARDSGLTKSFWLQQEILVKTRKSFRFYEEFLSLIAGAATSS